MRQSPTESQGAFCIATVQPHVSIRPTAIHLPLQHLFLHLDIRASCSGLSRVKCRGALSASCSVELPDTAPHPTFSCSRSCLHGTDHLYGDGQNLEASEQQLEVQPMKPWLTTFIVLLHHDHETGCRCARVWQKHLLQRT